MHFHMLSSTRCSFLFVCWIVALGTTEGLIVFEPSIQSSSSSTAESTTATRIPSILKTNSRTTSSTMLSYTTSATAAATTSAASTLFSKNPRVVHPRRSTQSASSTSLDMIGKIPPGGAAFTRGSSTTKTTSSTSLFSAASGETPGCPFTTFAASFGSLWGSFGVIYILAKGITRVLPLALEPLYGDSSLVLTPIQWSMYALSCMFFAYAEGYKGFHLKFSPLVVKRSFTLVIGTAQGNNPFNFLLAPLYSMGLWGATKKRMKVSWMMTIGISAIVALVKRLPPVSRCIVDAGVCVGLTIGATSIFYHFMSAMVTGKLPGVDACIPRREKLN